MNTGPQTSHPPPFRLPGGWVPERQHRRPDAELRIILEGLGSFLQSEWWPQERLLAHQMARAGELIRHAAGTVPFYADRLTGLPSPAGGNLDYEAFRSIPLLTRAEIIQHDEGMLSNRIPADHGSLTRTSTSGSTGKAVTITSTALVSLYKDICLLREHYWHRRDLSATLAAIRLYRDHPAPAPDGSISPNWGRATRGVFRTGQAFGLDIQTDISVQAEWLQRRHPAYLLTYPSNLHALAEYCRDHAVVLDGLREVRTFGEVVNPETRDLCRAVWDVKLVDSYSSEEFSYLAIQCPEHDHYHVQSENVLVEVLDAEGNPCAPGETGRVVITALNNFAMPLIRYEIGDQAEVGEPCPCGRGLPVLRRIMGRVRNMLVMPNGEKRWPLIGFRTFLSIAPIDHYQIVQKTREDIEARLVVPRPLSQSEEDALRQHLQTKMGHPFNILFSYLDEIPRSASGKFEEFVSEVK